MVAEGLQPQRILDQEAETPQAASLLRRFQEIQAARLMT
jgi:hypothetical protein